MKTVLALGLLSLTIAGCGQSLSPTNNFESVYNSIDVQDLRQHTKTLASDAFEGRLPTTEGEKKTSLISLSTSQIRLSTG